MSGGVVSTIVDRAVRDRAARWLARTGARLPTFAELAEPSRIPEPRRTALRSVDPDRPDPANLFRVHWYNDGTRAGFSATPSHLVFPPSLTGVRSPIVMALGCFFPMIDAHKVLAAYGCLIPHLVTGRFDPARHRAVWPSTGNYCRGGIAISRILDCRGIAVLPEGMSEERFDWLRAWVPRPEDIVRTPGSESNVKEIYDRCADLARDPANLVLNQIGRIAREIGASVVDFLDVALRAGGPDDILGPRHPGAQPVEALLAHALRQHRDAAAIEDARDRDPAAAVIPGRRPNRPVTRRIEPAGHQMRDQTTIGRQHLVRVDHREEAAERHNDRRAHSGQRWREDEVRRGRGKPGAGAVVVPVHAKEIGRVGTIGVDGPQRGPARFGNTRRLGQLGKGRQPSSRASQPSRRAVANRAVDDCRHNPTAHLCDHLT